MIITIDGLPAAGKSTIARRLSQELGFRLFDAGTGIMRDLSDIWDHAIFKKSPILNDGMPRFLWRLGTLGAYPTLKIENAVWDEFFYPLYELVRRANIQGPERTWQKMLDTMQFILAYIEIKPTLCFYIEIETEESEKRAIDRHIRKHSKISEAERLRWRHTEPQDLVYEWWQWLDRKVENLYIINGMRSEENVFQEISHIIKENVHVET